MGVITCTTEISSSIPPERMFKASVLADTIIPKILPQAVKKVEILEGDGGAGTIKLITLGKVSPFKWVKHRMDSIHKASLTFCYSIIDGDAFSDKLEKISYEVKVDASSDGGSILKTTSNYYTIGEVSITEEQIKSGQEKAFVMFEAMEAYLLANPDA